MRAQALWNYRNEDHLSQAANATHYPNTTRTYVFRDKITLTEGERLAVWDLDGDMKTFDGPARIPIWRSYYSHMMRIVATDTQYLKLQAKDGSRRHIPGPVSTFLDPTTDSQVSVCNMVVLNANELIAVYERAKDGEVQRKLVKGPALYMPSPSEWFHEFSWGASSSQGSGASAPPQQQTFGRPARQQASAAAKKKAFHKVRTTPQTMDVVVEFVRTADDGLLDVSLLICYQLKKPSKMLDATSDPITDITNAVASDVVLAVSKTRFEGFKENSDFLNDLKTYRQASEQAKRIGFIIDRIQFKGYSAGDALQKMQNDRIQARTKLATQEETEKLNQRMLDFTLTKERERAEQKQQLEMAAAQAKIKIRQIQLDQAKMEQDSALKFDVLARESQLKAESEFIQKVKGLDQGADMSAYLTAKYSQPPTQVIRYEDSPSVTSDSKKGNVKRG